jgi:hypothetical protein
MKIESKTKRPKLSVIIATFDYRIEADFVASWTQRQSCADEDFEVIVVTHGRDPAIDTEVKAVLRDGDQLIHGDDPSENRMFRYNKGAQFASSQRLFFTEDHVIADVHCVSELIKAIDQDLAHAWVVSSDDFAKNRLGEAESVLCQRFLDAGYHGAPWKKVQVRGFMIKREWFNRLGQFPNGYGEFGATALGIEMLRHDCEPITVENAKVTHVNHHSLNGLCEDALSYFAGEGAYRSQHSTEYTEKYLGRDEVWRRRERGSKSLAKIELKTLVALASASPLKLLTRPRSAMTWAKQAVDTALRSMVGHRLDTFTAATQLQIAKLKWRLGRFFTSRDNQNFEKLWNALAVDGRHIALVNHGNGTEPLRVLKESETADQFQEARLLGFHAVESVDGKPFRWTRSVCGLNLPRNAQSYRLKIQSLAIRGPLTRLPLVVLIDGKRIREPQVQIFDDSILVHIDNSTEPDCDQSVLTIGCNAIENRRDPRQCSLPISSLAIQPVRNQSIQSDCQAA